VDVDHARLATIMNVRVLGKISLRSFARWGVLASVACALATAAAAPNPVSGSKPSVAIRPRPHAILIEAESGTVLFERAPMNLIAPASCLI